MYSQLHTYSFFGKKQALYIEFITSKLMYITNPDIKGIFIIHTKYGMMNVKLNMLTQRNMCISQSNSYTQFKLNCEFPNFHF